MIGILKDEEIEELLHRNIVGHLGCHDNELTYVVPISYAYDGKYIYCHTREGMKMQMMRKNPRICFQIEELENMSNWKSVVTQGYFEELKSDEERKTALRALLDRASPILASITTHLGKEWPFSPDDIKEIKGIVFRIGIDNKTGRFEKGQQSPPITG
jgi:nitroimidazol reductase NimA-like FMN-containing flavoprotein (pyridoxamine 5'-phosphate oxidase superfamily)